MVSATEAANHITPSFSVTDLPHGEQRHCSCVVLGGRNIVIKALKFVRMSRFVSLLRTTFGVVREHVGTDHFGNKYYYIPEQKTWTGKLHCRDFLETLTKVSFSKPVSFCTRDMSLF